MSDDEEQPPPARKRDPRVYDPLSDPRRQAMKWIVDPPTARMLRSLDVYRENPVVRQLERNREMMRRVAEDLTRNPVLEALERQEKLRRDWLLRITQPSYMIIDAVSTDYAARLFDQAQTTAIGLSDTLKSRERIADWIASQRTIIEAAGRADEEGKEFDLEAVGGPRLTRENLNTYLAIIAIIIACLAPFVEKSLDDGLTAEELRPIVQEQTETTSRTIRDESHEITEAITEQTRVLKQALEGVRRPEIHVTVEKGGRLIIKEGEAGTLDEPAKANDSTPDE
ncbi:MAG: hypothetical protein Q8K79_00610 [Solirubrobacteraceae bacterium]|nr:hypothetical protein [Solirubrobacteraceae bacterium]